MRRSLCVVVLATLLIAVYAVAQAQQTPAAKSGAQLKTSLTTEEMQQFDQERQDLKERLMETKLPEVTQLQAMHLLGATLMPLDPGHVMAVGDDLKLTQDQITQLQKVVQQGLEATNQILTQEQKTQLQQLKPALVNDLVRQLFPALQSAMTSSGGAGTPAAPGTPTPGEQAPSAAQPVTPAPAQPPATSPTR